MQRVFVLDRNKQPLAPCHPARARQLLRGGRAAVYLSAPFTIILLEREGGQVQEVALKVDPGSRTSGLALVQHNERGRRVVWAAHLHHRGFAVRASLLRRRQVRRNRRSRKTRYRPPRFENRRRPEGWLPPSLRSRVENVETWTRRLLRLAPVHEIAVETARFDTQMLQNPDISGVAYQQGEPAGYEVREYLLEKWGRTCAYCGATDTPLEVEHIVPRSRGGSDRVSNLTLACTSCNREKGSRTAAEYGFPQVQAQARRPLRDAAAINATRYEIGRRLKAFDIPVSFWSGGRTKFNRRRQGYAKEHWIDATCVGETGAAVYIPDALVPIQIRAVGRGRRQMCLMDRFGFPRTRSKRFERVHGFQTGDRVRAVVPGGKKAGVHVGRVAVRTSGSFRVGKVDGIHWKYCTLTQRADGYEYQYQESA